MQIARRFRNQRPFNFCGSAQRLLWAGQKSKAGCYDRRVWRLFRRSARINPEKWKVNRCDYAKKILPLQAKLPRWNFCQWPITKIWVRRFKTVICIYYSTRTFPLLARCAQRSAGAESCTGRAQCTLLRSKTLRRSAALV